MLSVIELVQFKQYLNKYGSTAEQLRDTPEVVREIKFGSYMPSSSIVYEEHSLKRSDTAQSKSMSTGTQEMEEQSQDEKGRLSEIAGALYHKYIERHCALEINISGPLRCKWDELHSANYPAEDVGELTSVVDLTLAEMLKYIRQSFLRYDISGRDKTHHV